MVSDFHLKAFKDEMGQTKLENLFTFERKLNLFILRNALLITNSKISKENKFARQRINFSSL